jgi:hypothetical protein
MEKFFTESAKARFFPKNDVSRDREQENNYCKDLVPPYLSDSENDWEEENQGPAANQDALDDLLRATFSKEDLKKLDFSQSQPNPPPSASPNSIYISECIIPQLQFDVSVHMVCVAKALFACTDLKSLGINGSLTPEMSVLKVLSCAGKKITSLSINNCLLTESTLEFIYLNYGDPRNPDKLESLSLRNCGITGESVVTICKLIKYSNIKFLDLSDNPLKTVNSLVWALEGSSTETLNLQNCQLPETSLIEISKIALKSLNVAENLEISSLLDLSSLVTLEHLDISGLFLPTNDIKFILSNFPVLKCVHFASPTSASVVEELQLAVFRRFDAISQANLNQQGCILFKSGNEWCAAFGDDNANLCGMFPLKITFSTDHYEFLAKSVEILFPGLSITCPLQKIDDFCFETNILVPAETHYFYFQVINEADAQDIRTDLSEQYRQCRSTDGNKLVNFVDCRNVSLGGSKAVVSYFMDCGMKRIQKRKETLQKMFNRDTV